MSHTSGTKDKYNEIFVWNLSKQYPAGFLTKYGMRVYTDSQFGKG